jgi:seryl-tRNA synthetase
LDAALTRKLPQIAGLDACAYILAKEEPMKIISILLLGALAIGCSSGAIDKETKRSEDRMAMQLSQAQAERDQLKTQLNKVQVDLQDARKNSTDTSQEVVLLRKQVQDLQNANTALSTQKEKLQLDLSNATAKTVSDGK